MEVTPEKVQEITKKYINPDHITVVVAGDVAKISGQVAPFGTVKTVKEEK